MSDEPFLTEIVLFSFNYAPRGWAQCNGQLLPINQNQAMFALIGTFYGGDGKTTFALPDLRGRAAVGAGIGPGLSAYELGQKGGSETVTLTQPQMASHTHAVSPASVIATARARAGAGNQQTPVGSVPAADASGTLAMYSNAPPDAGMNAAAVALAGTPTTSITGGNQPHENRQPYLPLTFCIALQGIFPSQN
jgi:microcystin-dependent protein